MPNPFPCSKEPALFDSEKGPYFKDVRRALRICGRCPIQAACRRAGRKGHEFGIWGGETQPERFAALKVTDDGECGTEVAFRLHLARGEECEECRIAHRERALAYDRARRARKREEQEAEFEEIPGSRVNPRHAPLRRICGTERGYRAHIKRGELQLAPHPECTCKEAHRLHRATKRQGTKVAA